MGSAEPGPQSIFPDLQTEAIKPPLKFPAQATAKIWATREDERSERSPEEAFRVSRSHQASQGNPLGFRLTNSERGGERAGP